MYYVVEKYYAEAGCVLMEIKKNVSHEDAVVMESDSYQCCEEFVNAYHEYVNEQMEEAELNKG